MNLKLSKGIDNIKFGMKRDEILILIGEPDEQKVEDGEEDKVEWVYNDLELSLSFYLDEGGKLGYIRTTNNDLIQADNLIIGSRIEEVAKTFFIIPSESWEIEDYYSFKTWFNEEYWLTLNIKYEKIIGVELGVPFKNEEDYDWPNER